MAEGNEGSIKTPAFGRKIIALKTIDSTNSYASSILEPGIEEGTVIVAEEQTAGRGRHGQSWSSEKGKNLTFSIILKPDVPAEFSGIISLYAALGVAETIRSFAGVTPECKWPNDVLVRGRKLCGILSEAGFANGKLSSAVVGIGINVNQMHFPPEIQPTPTSLQLETGHIFDLTSLLSAILERLESRYAQLRSGRYDVIIREWMKLSTTIGRMLTVRTGDRVIRGVATGVGEDGGLIVRSNGGEMKILAGHVSIDP